MRLIPPLLLLLLICSGTASAADCYLATTGNDGNTGASIAQAWLTPSYSVGELSAGDTLWVVDGIYATTATIAMTESNMGTESDWVNILAYNGTPIWDGSASGADIGFKVYWDGPAYSDGYIKMDGIWIRRYAKQQLYINNIEQMVFNNCTFSNIVTGNWEALSIIGDGIRDITFFNCTFMNSTDHGMSIEGDRYGLSKKSYNISITNCTYKHINNHPGIQLSDYITNVTISYCDFDDCYCGAGTYFMEAAFVNWSSDIIIEHCTFKNTDYYPIHARGTNNSIFRNNDIDVSGGAAAILYSFCENVTVRDNTINGSLYIHDDYFGEQANKHVYYENNVYTNINEVTKYLMRAGGNLTIIDDVYQPSFRVETINDEIAGTTVIEYSDGRVFDYSIVTGTTYSLTLPKWYPSKSNFTFGANADVLLDIDIIPYNITLLPTNSYLKNVTVNRESNSTYDITNITINSSVATNPTWINATMQNFSHTYNVSIDDVYTTQVVSDSGGVVRYQYTSSWSPHDFEFGWYSDAGFSGPPDPINLANTTGDTWVNHMWSAGSGNITDAYNVSVNSVWHNTTNEYHNNTGMAVEAWSNITVWAWNTTGGISQNSISQNTQNSGTPAWSPSIFGMYYNTSSPIVITIKGYDDKSHIFSRTPTEADGNATTSFKLVVTI